MSDEPEDQGTAPDAAPEGEKLQKVLARAGLGSRREVERWIEQGRVELDGRRARLGDRAGPDSRIQVDGRPVQASDREPPRRVVLYNKPEGEVVARTDPEGRPSVFRKLPRVRGRWIAVGRLDINTMGLLLFTNDGELAHELMHPAREVEREYACRIHGTVTDAMVEQLVAGVELEDGPAHFDVVESGMPLDEPGDGTNAWYHVIIREGRKREVRRLWEACGVQVARLIRVRYGPVVLPRDLARGRARELEGEACAELYRHVGLKPPERDRKPRSAAPRKGGGRRNPRRR